MLMVIDVGNTETVFGLYEGNRLKTHWRMSSAPYRTPDECWIFCKFWLESESTRLPEVEGVVISSVMPFLTTVLTRMCEKRLGKTPLIITAEIDSGMQILYDSPRDVGADRICDAVAGFQKYGGPLIVIDFGTATTFDVVSETGAYLGGAIALGLHGASNELHRLAAKLPRVELQFPDRVVGDNTEKSMQSGIMWGTISMIDGMIERIEHEMKWKKAKVIATGGLAESLSGRLSRIDHLEPFLTLDGMRLLYERISG